MRQTFVRSAILVSILVASTAQARPPAEVSRGQVIFENRCAICHDDGSHMLNDVGPALFGVVNRPVGSVPGYRYSPALRAAKKRGDRWTSDRLNRLLIEPTQVYMGTGMPVAVADPAQRRALLIYLKSLRPTD